MTVRPVVITGDPVLHTRARSVEVIDDEVRDLVADMFETMDAARGVGLAAPQVGVGLRIFTWAMRNGKIPSDRITVEATPLAIPQLIQATGARQYDVIQTAVIAIPPAHARGLQTRIMAAALQASPRGEGAGIWVKADSPIRTVADLRGKTVGSYGLRSTGYTIVRFALKYAHGLNVALEGGDFRQVEIQAPNLPAALAKCAARSSSRRSPQNTKSGLAARMRSDSGPSPTQTNFASGRRCCNARKARTASGRFFSAAMRPR